MQTRTPDAYAIQFAARHDVAGFLKKELEQRLAPSYPPNSALANILVTGEDDDETSSTAAKTAEWAEQLIAKRGLSLVVLGPARAALARIKERWRWHLVVRGSQEEVGRFVRYAAQRLAKGSRDVRVAVDRDPVSLL